MDKPVEEILSLMNDAIEKGFDCYVKWTCPACRQRAVSTDKNTFYTKGYLHEDCGYLYTGKMFGLLASMKGQK